MLSEKIKNKLTQRATKDPTRYTYTIAPKVASNINVFDLNDVIDASIIVDNIKKYRELNPISNESNVQAWHSSWHLHLESKAFDKLVNVVEDKVLQSLDQTVLRKVQCVESWAIIYKEGDKTVRHKHSDQQYSAVYYAKAEKDASCLNFDNLLHIYPKTGMLVCFPGWLWHAVPQVKNDQERICMSFNLNVLMTVSTRVNHE